MQSYYEYIGLSCKGYIKKWHKYIVIKTAMKTVVRLLYGIHNDIEMNETSKHIFVYQ